ncbi:MAG TPA: putative Ig domain-containing protein, partial [Opitutaceae bacterium]
GYVPGMEQNPFPVGTGKRLKPNSSVTFQMHYTSSGQAESDETQLGFYFAPEQPERELLTRAAASIDLTIAPGARDYERTATLTPSATRDVMLYELSPHMHYRGKRFRYEAVYPGGATEVLLNVPNYNFDWQSLYRLAQPKRLPAGTVLRVVGAFDNSAQNPYNPHPAATVRFGEQTDDEMFIGYINYAELPARAAAPAPTFSGNTSARARVGEAFSLALRAANAPTAWRAASLPAGLRLDAATGALSGTPTAAGRHAILVTAENASGAATMVVDLAIGAPAAPVFTLQPRSVRTRIGGVATFTAAVDAAPGTVYTWFFRGGEFCNTDAPVLELKDVTAGYVGEYYCVAANASGAARSVSATLSLDAASLVNLSARANVGTGAAVVIPGITVRGAEPKSLLIRAAGPALTGFGVTGALGNPLLSVFNAAGEKVLENDNWNEVPDVPALRATTAAQGAFALPEGSRDAAMLVTLPPGSYTVQVSGAGTGAAAQGVAIVEVYEADQATSTLVNLSCRARVGTGADILIAGFVIGGTEPRRMLVRGIGPTLGALGVTGTLADPTLEILRQGAAATIPPVATNDNWDASLATTFSAVGAFPLTVGSRDAALVVTLAPGTYTAQLSGVGGTTGVGLIEVYELP